jgi:hypothetical protein
MGREVNKRLDVIVVPLGNARRIRSQLLVEYGTTLVYGTSPEWC